MYFGEPASKLTVPQAAMLAALANLPGYFSTDPSAGAAYTGLVARWHYVLKNMVRDGNISLSDFTNISGCTSAGITSCTTKPKNFPKVDYHFASAWTGAKYYIMNMVEQELVKTYKLTPTQLDTGGYKITTTIRPTMMRGLAAAVAKNKRLMRAGGKALPVVSRMSAPPWSSRRRGPSSPSTADPATTPRLPGK